jgi:hypothetical protein
LRIPALRYAAVSSYPLRWLLSSKVQLACDLYCRLDGSSYWAAIFVDFKHAFYALAVLFFGRQVDGVRDPLEHKHVVFCLYLPDGVSVEAVLVKGNLTRCQRARESAQQSATCRRDQVI